MVQQLLNEDRGLVESEQTEDDNTEVQMEEEQEPEKIVRSENHTVTYFKEMARYSTLTSEDEISLGRSIREIRVSLWTHLLQFDFARHTLMEEIQNIETDIPDSLISFISQKTLTPKKNKRNSDSSQENPLDAAARELNKIDLDEIALGKILDMVSRQFSGSQGVKLRKSKKTFAFFHEIEQLLKELKHVKHQFINANLRLVIAVARRYNNGPMTLIDLIQEGNIGLMKAVDRFDPDRGYRFSTYAAWWIRHAVSRASADKGRTVRLPVHFIESYQQLSRIKRELQVSLDRMPTSEEVAKGMGISRRKVDRIEGYLREGTLSLDRKVNSNDSRSFMEMLEDPSTEMGICSEIIHERELKLSDIAISEALSPMEREVIIKRYGLDCEEPCTLKEIGALYQLSRERIRQIQENALVKIRKYFSENGML